MNHKEKIKMARKMLTKTERESRTPIFQSMAWEKRKDAIRKRVLKKKKK